MSRPLRVAVLRDRYQTKFNIPRVSRHQIIAKRFVPFNKISNKLEGLTFISPIGFDLGHFHNRIPINTRQPFVLSFESHLPRYFGGERTRLFSYLLGRLVHSHCRRIIAMSECAKRNFMNQHGGRPEFSTLADKLLVHYPNMVIPPRQEIRVPLQPPLRLIFVGAHFGRKGGAVAVRAAEIARAKRLPIYFTIISSLDVRSWVDAVESSFYDPYFKLLNAENVEFHGPMSNRQVLERFRTNHFSILATLSDTFGFSAVESMSVGTPVIATPQGALPEFIFHGENGLMLGLEVDRLGVWVHAPRTDKGSDAYADVVRKEIERLAVELIEAVAPFCDRPQDMLPLRLRARETVEKKFDSVAAQAFLDDLYEQCLAES